MMTTIQERLQRKREPLDRWSTREQLCLAFAVARSGDQNWMSVSRALKPFGDQNRPLDWFHQKNCAAQYGALLENVETPKRKKRASGVDAGVEAPSESILRKLVSERRAELKRLMDEERTEYLKLQEEMSLLKSGNLTEEQLDIMCKQIDEEEAQKEKEAAAHSQWLKERELRKQEIERAWRPMVKITSPLPMGQKRKASDGLDSLIDVEQSEDHLLLTPTPEPSKHTLSPLLTSLLKSPSHAQNVATSSILHSAITSQRPVNSMPNSTIASLLNTSATVQVSPSLQQLVSTAISQEPISAVLMKDPISDLLDETDPLPNLKPEDIESTILSVDDPLPEIKNEEVDVIISDLIENADIVTDPEQHLLDSNDGILDFENQLEELVNKEKDVAAAAEMVEMVEEKLVEKQKPSPEIDPFEFQEDPEVYEPAKLTSTLLKQHNSVQVPVPEVAVEPPDEPESPPELIYEKDIKQEVIDEVPEKRAETTPGSVEIVEVVVLEDEDISKELNKSQIQDIVHSASVSVKQEDEDSRDEMVEIKSEPKNDNENDETISEATSESLEMEIKQETSDDQREVNTDPEDTSSRRNTFTPEYSEDIFDDINIEVRKMDKVGKAKRDYSRTKKKEETDFDILLAVEQAVNSNLDEDTESLSEKEDDRKSDSGKPKIKIENERSNSPWTEEEEANSVRARRRYSTPATPTDSIPNSPASCSAYFDDDRDHRNWKKSIMLLYSRLSTHKYASLFSKPITNEQAPGYHNMVYRPMDLQTLRKNIESGVIKTTAEFQRDVLLMFNNAIMFNKTLDTVYRMATEMQEEGVEQIQILLEAQTDTPARRETRTSEGPGTKRKRGNEDLLPVKIKKRKED